VESSNLTYLSRRDLVLIMANEDGGGHVDPQLDTEYEALTVDNLGTQLEFGVGIDKTMGGDIPPVGGDVAAASVRQIAFEILQTLRPTEDNSGPTRILPSMRPLWVG